MLKVNEHQKHGVTLDELYFADDWKTAQSTADISTFLSCKVLPPQGIPYKLKTNMGIDLTQSREEILTHYTPKHHKKSLQYLESGLCRVERSRTPSMQDLQEFCDFFNIFAKTKGIYTLEVKNLLPYLEKDCYLCTRLVEVATDKVLAYNTLILAGKRASAQVACTHLNLESDSVRIRLLSNANKSLYLSNIFYLKEMGMELMDFGGYRIDKDGNPKDGVDEFKRRFGGFLIKEYSFFYPRTLKGKMAIKFLDRNVEDL